MCLPKYSLPVPGSCSPGPPDEAAVPSRPLPWFSVRPTSQSLIFSAREPLAPRFPSPAVWVSLDHLSFLPPLPTSHAKEARGAEKADHVPGLQSFGS